MENDDSIMIAYEWDIAIDKEGLGEVHKQFLNISVSQ